MSLDLQSILVCMEEESSYLPGRGPQGATTVGHMRVKPAHRWSQQIHGDVGHGQNLWLSCGAWKQGMG